MATLAIYVTPKSGRDEIVGWRGTELAVKVTAAPEAGKANATACSVIASALGVPKSAVRVVRGDTARHKTLAIEGVDEETVRTAFGAPDAALF